MAIAIVRPIRVRKGNLAGLHAVIEYIKDNTKTKNSELIFAWNCLKGKEFQQMLITKNLFGKTTGRQYAHFVQSFSDNDKLSPETAHEIGRKFIASLPQFQDFQVVMATHTNEEHLHNHIIVNSVNIKSGSKWQFSKEDLKFLRERSDEFCRTYGLSVIEHGSRGHKSYGEYTAYKSGVSWKEKLAVDIASCMENSKSRTDFLHKLDALGIDADFGDKNVMFTVSKDIYGLDKEMKCSNFKLMSYGDFSKQNIESHFKFNSGVVQYGYATPDILQDCLLSIGAAKSPNNPDYLQNMYFDSIDFDALTKEEILIYIKRKTMERLQLKAWAEYDEQNRKSCLSLQEINQRIEALENLFQKENFDYIYDEQENEYEL